MEMQSFVRKPFVVEAVEITKENIAEIATLVGKLKEKDGEQVIEVNRKKVPNLYEVSPGFWMTKMNGKIRCYSERVFKEQFTGMTPEIDSWVEFLNNTTAGEVDEVAVVNHNVFEEA